MSTLPEQPEVKRAVAGADNNESGATQAILDIRATAGLEARDVTDPRRIIWEPTQQAVENSNMYEFMTVVNERWGLDLKTFDELYQWSINQPEQFWETLWYYFGFGTSAHRQPDAIMTPAERMMDVKWFPGAELNFAERLLSQWRNEKDQHAVIFRGESGAEKSLTGSELYKQVASMAKALKECGVGPGDRVAAYMPNVPEAIVAMLAATSLGAIWSSASPDFGAEGVIDRFGQIEPKILITADGQFYKGKEHDLFNKAQTVAERIPSIEKIVVVPFLKEKPDISAIEKAVLYGDFLGDETESAEESDEIDFAKLPFDHPLYIMFTSGTTRKPKCMVHGAGRVLLQHLKEHSLHTDLKPGDKLFYQTTLAWMMWNWIVSALATKSTVMLYDGDPFAENGNVLLRFAAERGITHFGTNPGFLSALEKTGQQSEPAYDFSKLRTVISTGKTLPGSGFDYILKKFGAKVQPISISGGTDLIGCWALGAPSPVHRECLQMRGLGSKVEIVDQDGQPLPTGKIGEMVCTASHMTIPLYFWGDPNGEKFTAAYFDRFGHQVWQHHDFAEMTPEGGMVFHGRSDDTINRGGVRIGTAEIESPVLDMLEIQDCAVIRHKKPGAEDEQIILFVQLKPGIELDDTLQIKIKGKIRTAASPRHVPDSIFAVPEIPKTVSGKTPHDAIRKTVGGQPVTNKDAFKNPDALEHFRGLVD